MKNLLSENMLRFGVKNLNESQQRELVVKSIMETINQHGLANVIRHRLNEDIEPKPDQAMLGQAMKVIGTMQKLIGQGKEEGPEMMAAIAQITSQNYSACRYYIQTKGVNGKRYSKIADWLGTAGVDKEFMGSSNAEFRDANPFRPLYNLGSKTGMFFNRHMAKVAPDAGETLQFYKG